MMPESLRSVAVTSYVLAGIGLAAGVTFSIVGKDVTLPLVFLMFGVASGQIARLAGAANREIQSITGSARTPDMGHETARP
jgi:hypothetical protein